jgi:hypothetical protein
MSFIDRSIPSGDRDDAPELSFEVPAKPVDPLAGLNDIVIALGQALLDGFMAYAELSDARKAGSKLDANVAANRMAAAFKGTHAKAAALSKAIIIRRS